MVLSWNNIGLCDQQGRIIGKILNVAEGPLQNELHLPPYLSPFGPYFKGETVRIFR